MFVTGYDLKLICRCPDYDVKFIWHHQGKDIVSVVSICAAAVDFLCWSYPTYCASSLGAGQWAVFCIILTVRGPLVNCVKGAAPQNNFLWAY